MNKKILEKDRGRLPCLMLEPGKDSVVVPLPGAWITIGPITNIKMHGILDAKKAFLILYNPWESSSTMPREGFGVYAHVVKLEVGQEIFVTAQSAFRIRFKNLAVNPSGYAESEWEAIKDEAVSEEEFSSESFRREVSALATLSYLVCRKYRRGFLKETFFTRPEERSGQGAAVFVDRMAHFLNAWVQEQDMRWRLGKMVGESSVRKRLWIAIEAYRVLWDRDRSFEVFGSGGLETFYTRKEDLVKIPKRLYRILLRSSTHEGIMSFVPLPGFFAVVEGFSDLSAYDFFSKSPYFIYDCVDPETDRGGTAGILMRVYAVSRNQGKLDMVIEAVARVTLGTPPALSGAEETTIAWEPLKEEYPSRERCLDEDFLKSCMKLEGIAAFVSAFVGRQQSDNPANLDEELSRAFERAFEENREVLERLRNRFGKDPKELSQFIDEQAKTLNELSGIVPSVHYDLHALVKEPNVGLRLLIATHAFGDAIAEARTKLSAEESNSPHSHVPGDFREYVKAQRTILPGEDLFCKEELGGTGSESQDLALTEKLETQKRSPEAQRLKDFLSSKIVGGGGQQRAINHLVDAYEWYLSPLWRPETLIFYGFFVGPSGVGKTELAKKLAEFFFDDEQAMTKIVGGDYKERHEITARLIGASPGYVGFGDRPQLGQDRIDRYAILKRIRELEKKIEAFCENKEEVQKIREEQEDLRYQLNPIIAVEKMRPVLKRPYRTAEDAEKQPFFSVVLVDEIEKAHRGLREFLLELLAEGSIKTASGEMVSFHHSFVIMTSNLAARKIADALSGGARIGLRASAGDLTTSMVSDDALYKMVMRELKRDLEPEFLGRIEEDIIMFSQLKPDEIELIRDRQVAELSDLLTRVSGISFSVTKEVGAFILRESTDHPEYGARLLEGKIRHVIEIPLSRLLNTGQVKQGDSVVVELETVNGKETPVFRKKPDNETPDDNVKE